MLSDRVASCSQNDTIGCVAGRSIALQMHEERGRGTVLRGIARVDTALERSL